MSYCRWSSDNFNCDIYAYESDDGFVIHVGTGRYKGEIPKCDFSLIMKGGEENVEEYMRQRRIQAAYFQTCGTELIGLPEDGETFTLSDIEDFYNKMVELKNIGYIIPDGVIEGIKEEINESHPNLYRRRDLFT